MRAIAGKLAAARPAALLARMRGCGAHATATPARPQLLAGAAGCARQGGFLSPPHRHRHPHAVYGCGHGAARLLHGTARMQQDTTGKGTGDEASGASVDDDLDDDFEPDFEREMDDLHIDGDDDLDDLGDLVDDADGLSDNLAGFYEESIDAGMHGDRGDALQSNKRTFVFSVEHELVNVLGPDPEVDFSKDANTSRFMELLMASPFASMGHAVEGVHVEGVVAKADSRGYNVDCGLKFDVRVKRPRAPQFESRYDGERMSAVTQAAREDDLKPGDPVEIVLKDLERTAHLQGDSKHSSIYIGLGDIASPSF